MCVVRQQQVADSMSAIWSALLDDPRAELDKHFDAIARYETISQSVKQSVCVGGGLLLLLFMN